MIRRNFDRSAVSQERAVRIFGCICVDPGFRSDLDVYRAVSCRDLRFFYVVRLNFRRFHPVDASHSLRVGRTFSVRFQAVLFARFIVLVDPRQTVFFLIQSQFPPVFRIGVFFRFENVRGSRDVPLFIRRPDRIRDGLHLRRVGHFPGLVSVFVKVDKPFFIVRFRGRVVAVCCADRDPAAVGRIRTSVRRKFSCDGDAVFADDPDRVFIYDLDVCGTLQPLNVHDLLKGHAKLRSEPNERTGTDFHLIRDQLRLPACMDLPFYDDRAVRGKRHISLQDLRDRTHVGNEPDLLRVRIRDVLKQTVDERDRRRRKSKRSDVDRAGLADEDPVRIHQKDVSSDLTVRKQRIQRPLDLRPRLARHRIDQICRPLRKMKIHRLPLQNAELLERVERIHPGDRLRRDVRCVPADRNVRRGPAVRRDRSLRKNPNVDRTNSHDCGKKPTGKTVNALDRNSHEETSVKFKTLSRSRENKIQESRKTCQWGKTQKPPLSRCWFRPSRNAGLRT